MALASAFFPAFLLTMDNFAERDYFAKEAPDHSPTVTPITGIPNESAER